MSIDDSILREQLRQQERKKQKVQKSMLNKKAKFYEAQNRKKKTAAPEIITASDYKKINDDSAKRKAYNNLRTWFHLYVRARDLFIDKDGKIKGYCIYCKRIWNVEFYSDKSIMNIANWSACHFFRADLFASIEFDEANVHLGCNSCNRYAGDLSKYKNNLIEKIGQKEFDSLDNRKNKAHSLNILEMVKLKEKYMDKAKAEIKRLGIKL